MELNKLEKKQKYQREWIKTRRQEWVEENGPCKHCGTWDKLEVDHIKPELKSMHTASIWSRTAEVRKKEIHFCMRAWHQVELLLMLLLKNTKN